MKTKKSNLFITLLFFVSVSHSLLANTSTLYKADSLFKEKKFTESFELYNTIFEKEESYSPQVLLKMAYIKEGLGDITSALQFLNTLYYLEPSEELLYKIEDLAKKQSLEGYKSSDTDILFVLKHKHLQEVTYVLIGLIILCFGIIILHYKKEEEISIVFYSVISVFIIGLFYFSNFRLIENKGIINHKYAYLRELPSGSADIISTLPSGTKVNVFENDDVWKKIVFEGEEGYVKQSKIKSINF